MVVWVTSGRPPSGRDHTAALAGLIEAADVVHVADLLEALARAGAAARLLPPAAAARRAGPGERRAATARGRRVRGRQRRARPPARSPRPSGRRWVRIADQVDVLLLDHRLPARGRAAAAARRARAPGRATPRSAPLSTRAPVVVDGPRRTPGDTWTVLEAAAAGYAGRVARPGCDRPTGWPSPAPATARVAVRAEVVARLHQPRAGDREALAQRRAVLAGHTFADRVAGMLDVGRPAGAGGARGAPSRRSCRPTGCTSSTTCSRRRPPGAPCRRAGARAARRRARARRAAGPRARTTASPDLEVVEAPSHLTLGAVPQPRRRRRRGRPGRQDGRRQLLRRALPRPTWSPPSARSRRGHRRQVGALRVAALQRRGRAALPRRRAHLGRAGSRAARCSSRPTSLRELRFGDLPRAVDSDILDRAIERRRADLVGRPVQLRQRARRRTAPRTPGRSRTSTFLTAAGRLAFYGDPRSHVEV